MCRPCLEPQIRLGREGNICGESGDMFWDVRMRLSHRDSSDRAGDDALCLLIADLAIEQRKFLVGDV